MYLLKHLKLLSFALFGPQTWHRAAPEWATEERWNNITIWFVIAFYIIVIRLSVSFLNENVF